MINYGKQNLDSKDINEVIKVLKTDFITQGSKIKEFEDILKKKFGSKFCTVVSSGTSALHLAGLALNWKKGDIVLTSPISFLASANCIVYSNATPDFADIDEKTYTLDPEKVEIKIHHYRKKGKKIKSIIGVDYAGHPCDWESLRYLSNKYNISLINDNCHALGSSYKGNINYAVKYADIVTQSYHPVKAITTGEGGSVFSNDNKIDNFIKMYRNHGLERNEKLKSKQGLWLYKMNHLGYNYRITDFQCALGISQLSKLDKFIKKRNLIAFNYNKVLKNYEKFIIPSVSKNVKHSYHIYPLRINFKKTSINKKKLFVQMKKSGINLMVHYIPIHLQPFYKKRYNFKLGDYAISEKFYREQCSLPIYPSLNTEQQNFIIGKLIKYTN